MRVIWEWNTKDELKHVSKWIENLVTIVGVPAVLIFTGMIFLPVLEDPKSLYVLLPVIVFFLWIIKDADAGDEEIINNQVIKIYPDRIWQKHKNTESVHYFKDIQPHSLRIKQQNMLKQLIYVSKSTNVENGFMLVGMPKEKVQKLLRVVRHQIQFIIVLQE